MVLRLIRALPGAPGFLATIPCATRLRRRNVDTSVGVSGPHDFAVRIDAVRRHDQLTLQHRYVHRIPHPTFVTIAKRPSYSRRDGQEDRCDLPDDASVHACDKVTRRAICAWQIGGCVATIKARSSTDGLADTAHWPQRLILASACRL
jgi:hypothetical protein